MDKIKKAVVYSFCTLLSIVLSSCGSNLATDLPYVIYSTEKFNTSKTMCIYSAETGIDHIHYIDVISIVDSIGKFNIGDTLYLSPNNR